jgi:hypothetical protein
MNEKSSQGGGMGDCAAQTLWTFEEPDGASRCSRDRRVRQGAATQVTTDGAQEDAGRSNENAAIVDVDEAKGQIERENGKRA